MNIFQEFEEKFSQKNFEKSRRFSGEYTPETIKRVLNGLDHPQEKYKTIHIAGTTGKSTVAFYIGRLLGASNYKVGLYTSPHLHHLSERIKINEDCIDEKAFQECWAEIEKDPLSNQLSFFDVLTAIAFLYFCKQGVDYAVIETGLGGRLDSTNNLQPEFCCLTPISLDHTEVLGDTLEAITMEKAGIIKAEIPVYSATQEPAAAKTLRAYCKKIKAPLTEIEPDQSQAAHLRGLDFARKVISMSGIGKLQDIDEQLPARMERFKKDQAEIFFDSAHAIDSISDLVTNLMQGCELNTTVRLFINTFKERNLIGLLQKLEAFKNQCKMETYLLRLNDNRFWNQNDIPTMPWVEPKEVLSLALKPGLNIVTGSTQMYPMINSLFQS